MAKTRNNATRIATLRREATQASDLQYCYDRLSHLFFIFQFPDSPQASFGPGETMTALQRDLPIIQARNDLKDGYAKERARRAKTLC